MPDENDGLTDSYCTEYLRSYLDRPHFRVNALDLRVFSLMGDRVAVNILRALTWSASIDPERLSKILVATTAAMEYPSSIQNEHDRIPAVTICLLESLISRTELEGERASIVSALQKIRMNRTRIP